jgi:hypothetical protein
MVRTLRGVFGAVVGVIFGFATGTIGLAFLLLVGGALLAGFTSLYSIDISHWRFAELNIDTVMRIGGITGITIGAAWGFFVGFSKTEFEVYREEEARAQRG